MTADPDIEALIAADKEASRRLDAAMHGLSDAVDDHMTTHRELILAAKQALAYVDSLHIGNQATERLRVAVARAEGRA